jgi:hypothetical protein
VCQLATTAQCTHREPVGSYYWWMIANSEATRTPTPMSPCAHRAGCNRANRSSSKNHKMTNHKIGPSR